MKLQNVWADIYEKCPCPEHTVQTLKSNVLCTSYILDSWLSECFIVFGAIMKHNEIE